MSSSSLRNLLASCSLLALACTTEPPALIPSEPDAGPQTVEPDAGVSTCQNGMRDGDETQIDCGGSCEPCPDGAMCVDGDDCQSGVCSRGFCLTRSCEDGVRNGPEVGVDCGGDCGLCPDGETCSSSSECQSGHCRSSMCVPSQCDDGRTNGQESDTDCGGSDCAPCGPGLECNDDRDCATLRCTDGVCDVASCSDRIQNQDETSVDCGGAICAPCQDLLQCEFDLDCISGRCVDNGCISCRDGVRNADESDVDCGGTSCEGCRDGKTCSSESDCASGRCLDGLCISCADGVQNGDESDVDCGGAACVGCGTGGVCNADFDCASNVCIDGLCRGYGDTCERPIALVAGDNTINWVADTADYLTSAPSCSTSSLTGPDLVMSYTATLDGLLEYSIAKPTSNRWSMVVSTGECGTLTPEQHCHSDSTASQLASTFPVTAGTTYHFYLRDTTVGSLPLSSPLAMNINEFVPPCTPGVGGVVGTSTTRHPSVAILGDFVAADADPAGYVYFGGTSDLRRMPKAGGTVEDIESAANLTTTDLGYAFVIAGNEMFSIDDSSSSTSNRVVRITTDGGTTWIDGGEDYASFSSTPEDFRGAVALDGMLYLIVSESSPTEIWSLPLGATTTPVAATRVGTIPFGSCTGLAADASYFYTACWTSDEIVRIDRATLATTVIASDADGLSFSSVRNDLAVDDLDGDGIADVLYFTHNLETIWYMCAPASASPFMTVLYSWGTSTSYGFSLDPVSSRLYVYDESEDELLILE